MQDKIQIWLRQDIYTGRFRVEDIVNRPSNHEINYASETRSEFFEHALHANYRTMTYDAKRVELHNLTDDRAEAKDVAKEHPEIVACLSKLGLDWKATLPEKPNR